MGRLSFLLKFVTPLKVRDEGICGQLVPPYAKLGLHHEFLSKCSALVHWCEYVKTLNAMMVTAVLSYQ